MNKILEKLNKQLEQGVVPDELVFNRDTTGYVKFDWDKVKYNTFYKDKRYIERQFPPGYESIPGFEKIFELMAEHISSPLEEMLKITEQ